ncbi:Sodium/sulfate symporter, partial [Candidatus Magnetomorum sp. HK-1]
KSPYLNSIYANEKTEYYELDSNGVAKLLHYDPTILNRVIKEQNNIYKCLSNSSSLIKKISSRDDYQAVQKERLKQSEEIILNTGIDSEYRQKIMPNGTKTSIIRIFNYISFQLKENMGWFLCMILPLISYYIAKTNHFTWDQTIFLCVLSSAIVMWMFKLVGDFIVSIYILIACLTLKIAPVKIVLGGFISGSFFLAMSVFGLGAVLLNSGLIYRLSLMILYYFPPTLFWQNLALSIVGTIITPIMPSANGRLVLVSPTVMDMTEIMGFKKLSNAGVRLSMSTLNGFGLMSNFFLTGKSINFVILGLLPMELQTRFTFLFWLIAAAVACLVSFWGRFFLAAFLYKTESPPIISKRQIKAQLQILGKLNFSEWIAVIACSIFLIGAMTSFLHKIKTAWVGVLILFIVLFVGELEKDDFKQKIDWPFLLFLGGLIGFVRTFTYLELDKWMGQQLFFLTNYMTSDIFMFIIVLSGIIMIIRFVLPANATVAVLCAILMPVANLNGINPWVIGFCVLVISGGWFFPYQSTFYITFYNSTKGKLFTDQQTALFNMYGNIINVLSLILSIPYWRMIGLLK